MPSYSGVIDQVMVCRLAIEERNETFAFEKYYGEVGRHMICPLPRVLTKSIPGRGLSSFLVS
jgi:hypothetical protein